MHLDRNLEARGEGEEEEDRGVTKRMTHPHCKASQPDPSGYGSDISSISVQLAVDISCFVVSLACVTSLQSLQREL